MAEMNKQIIFRGYTINMTVILNTLVERRLDGRRCHTVQANCSDIYELVLTEVEDCNLLSIIKTIENEAKLAISKKLDEPDVPDMRLYNLGFR